MENFIEFENELINIETVLKIYYKEGERCITFYHTDKSCTQFNFDDAKKAEDSFRKIKLLLVKLRISQK